MILAFMFVDFAIIIQLLQIVRFVIVLVFVLLVKILQYFFVYKFFKKF